MASGKRKSVKSPIASIYRGMKTRCYNKDNRQYPDYGGRGIKICDRWLDFNLFQEDMLPSYKRGLTIERVDVNGNYEPSNCTWIPLKEQGKNTRKTKRITLDGQTLIIEDWARKTGISATTIQTRIKKGWAIKDTLETPTAPYNSVSIPGVCLNCLISFIKRMRHQVFCTSYCKDKFYRVRNRSKRNEKQDDGK